LNEPPRAPTGDADKRQVTRLNDETRTSYGRHPQTPSPTGMATRWVTDGRRDVYCRRISSLSIRPHQRAPIITFVANETEWASRSVCDRPKSECIYAKVHDSKVHVKLHLIHKRTNGTDARNRIWCILALKCVV